MVAAKRSARADRSVAVTARGVGDRCSACTPQPVPRSSAVPTGRADGRAGEGRGGAADAEHVVAGERLARAGTGRQVGRGPTTRPRTARGRRPAAGRRRARSTSPAARASASGSGASAAATASSGSVCAQTNSRISVSSGSPPAVARSAARKSLRATADVAAGPSRSAMPVAVKPAPVSAVAQPVDAVGAQQHVIHGHTIAKSMSLQRVSLRLAAPLSRNRPCRPFGRAGRRPPTDTRAGRLRATASGAREETPRSVVPCGEMWSEGASTVERSEAQRHAWVNTWRL